MKFLGAIAVVLLIVGCGSSETVMKTVDMNSWEVTSIGARSLADLDAALRPTMTFDAAKGQLSGSTGCNGYSGSYSMDAFGVEIGPIAATKKACPDMLTESAFMTALEKVARIDVGDDMLRLFDASGVEVMEAIAK